MEININLLHFLYILLKVQINMSYTITFIPQNTYRILSENGVDSILNRFFDQKSCAKGLSFEKNLYDTLNHVYWKEMSGRYIIIFHTRILSYFSIFWEDIGCVAEQVMI